MCTLKARVTEFGEYFSIYLALLTKIERNNISKRKALSPLCLDKYWGIHKYVETNSNK